MVTTRSADKRADAVRDEDLVLRSRTISSPESTPTQSKKRTATGRALAAPSAKRTRTTTDAVLDIAEDSQQPTGDEHNVEANNATKSPQEEIDDAASTLTVSTGNGATPPPKVPVVIVPPPPDSRQTSVQIPDSTPNQEEHFQTPATSRHKRFGSEEIDEETIVASHGTDDYETAEEVIEDSDEAPEIEVTKTSLASTKRRKPLMPKLVHRPSVTAVVNKAVDDEPTENETQSAASLVSDTSVEQGEDTLQTEPVEIRQPQIELSESSRPLQSPPAEELDPSTEMNAQKVPDLTTTNTDTNASDTQEPATLPVEVPTPPSNEPQAETTPSLSTSPRPRDFSLQQDFVSFDNTPPSAQQTTLAHTQPKTSHQRFSPVPESSRPPRVSNTTRPTTSRPVLGPNARLPNRAHSTLSGYKRNKLQNRLGTSGLQQSWKSKRSTFLIS